MREKEHCAHWNVETHKVIFIILVLILEFILEVNDVLGRTSRAPNCGDTHTSAAGQKSRVTGIHPRISAGIEELLTNRVFMICFNFRF